jgi:hypothetical protein
MSHSTLNFSGASTSTSRKEWGSAAVGGTRKVSPCPSEHSSIEPVRHGTRIHATHCRTRFGFLLHLSPMILGKRKPAWGETCTYVAMYTLDRRWRQSTHIHTLVRSGCTVFQLYCATQRCGETQTVGTHRVGTGLGVKNPPETVDKFRGYTLHAHTQSQKKGVTAPNQVDRGARLRLGR